MSESFCSQLVNHLRQLDRCVVAFSGGVDSAIVAKAARLAVGFENSLAVTAVSPSVAKVELETAKSVAAQIGIRHHLMTTEETHNAAYIVNDGRRCFHCKSELYNKLQSIAEQFGSSSTILNGTNQDDLGDYRPGLQAADDFSISSPLVDLKIDKTTVRHMAKHWNLSVWDKPAAPCLASRIAYGESVTAEKLEMVESAEAFLRQFGFKQLRVRFHKGKQARVEVDQHELPRLLDSSVSQQVSERLTELGFDSVEIDPEGFRSGKLNESLPTYQINPETRIS